MKVPFLWSGKENRYQRQEVIFGKQGQKRLSKSKVTIVGLGALGGMCSILLARAGVGQIHIIDGDVVEFVNLHRQLLYTENDVDKAKAAAAHAYLSTVNQDVKVSFDVAELNSRNAEQVIRKRDLILDCTDNLETRFLINDFCRKKKIPWISASAVRDLGRVIAFTHSKNSPCFRCIYEKKKHLMDCDNSGILNTVAAITGSLQSQAVIDLLLGKNPPSSLSRISLDSIVHVGVTRRNNCPLCAEKKFDYLNALPKKKIRKRGASYQFSGKPKNLRVLKDRLERFGKVDDYDTHLRFGNMIIFSDGRVIIRSESQEEAKVLYTKYFEGAL